MDFVIQLLSGSRKSLTIHAPGVEGYVIGRGDEILDYKPDLDMTSWGARDQGVSRRHAALVMFNNALHVIDLGSVNGTHVNGSRLVPHTPYPVHAGDELRFGHLAVMVLQPKD